MTRAVTSSTAKILFGLCSGHVLHVDELSPSERGLRCGCVCPEWETPLEARMGEKVRHYFAHSNSDRPCSTGAETGIHLAAKQLIAERLAIPVPPLIASVEELDSRGYKHPRDDPDNLTEPCGKRGKLECRCHCFRSMIHCAELEECPLPLRSATVMVLSGGGLIGRTAGIDPKRTCRQRRHARSSVLNSYPIKRHTRLVQQE